MTTDNRTEKEKMLAGDLYMAFGIELATERLRCKELVYDFNQTRPSEDKKRVELLKKIFGDFGENSLVETPMQVDYGYNVHFGKNSFANYNFVLLDTCPIYIGDFVLIGPDVKIYAATHPTDPQTRLDGPELGKPVRIGNNVWIGGSSVICPGVTIGDNSVIGAGSVVVKDIPANVVAVGHPCKVIKQLEAPTRQPEHFQQFTSNPLAQ